VGDFGTLRDGLVHLNQRRIHDSPRKAYGAGSHGDGVDEVDGVDDALSGADRDNHDVVDGDSDADGGQHEGGTGDEGDDQNREKRDPMVALEVPHVNPTYADDHQLLDYHGRDSLRDLEVELQVRPEEVSEVDAVVVAVDRTAELDLWMDAGDVHIVRNIDVHRLPRARMPLHNLQMWLHCSSHKPSVSDAKRRLAGGFERIVVKVPYQVNNDHGSGWVCVPGNDHFRGCSCRCDNCFHGTQEHHSLHANFDLLH